MEVQANQADTRNLHPISQDRIILQERDQLQAILQVQNIPHQDTAQVDMDQQESRLVDQNTEVEVTSRVISQVSMWVDLAANLVLMVLIILLAILAPMERQVCIVQAMELVLMGHLEVTHPTTDRQEV